MCLRVYANGRRRGAGTHVGVAIYLMQGEYDDHLTWPFNGDITIQLVNQRRNKGHIERTEHFNENTPNDHKCRVTEDEKTLWVWGCEKFILHSSLHYDDFWNTEYLKNDSLEFRVTQVKLCKTAKPAEAYDQQSTDTEQPELPPIPPVNITMSNFISHIMSGESWCSPPFYSHIGGYKMCLRVDANGWGDGAGTHVGVGIHLMYGGRDDRLTWPLSGNIMVQLVNQRRDNGHIEKTFDFNDNTSGECKCRVTEGEVALVGWGCEQFIPHSSLQYDDYKHTEYLKNDCLQFRITQVKLTIPVTVIE